MNKALLNILGVSISVFFFSSCVSNKKYNEAQSSISNLRNQNKELREDLGDTRRRLQLMEEANQSAAGQLDEKDRILTQNQQEIANQQEKLRQLQDLINQQKARTESLRQKMAKALGGFS